MGRCPLRLRDVEATAGGNCHRRLLRGTFNEDLIEGHSSEAIEAMLCSGQALDIVLRQVVYAYRYWSLEGDADNMAILYCK